MTAESRSRAWGAGLAALIGGFVLYATLSGLGGGIDWEDRLTFDQSGELELEGLGILYGIVLGAGLGAPISAYVFLRAVGAAAPGRSALLILVACVCVTALAMRVVPTEPGAPVLAPYFVFGGWFLAGLASRWMIERGLKT